MKGFLILVMLFNGLINLSLSDQFWTQLRTYGWTPVTAVVMSHDIRADKNSAEGQVVFQYELAGAKTYGLAKVSSGQFEFWGIKAKQDAFIARYAAGTKMTAYISKDGKEVSLGHFPLEGFGWRVFGAFVWFLCSGAWTYRWWKERRATKARGAAPLPNLVAAA